MQDRGHQRLVVLLIRGGGGRLRQHVHVEVVLIGGGEQLVVLVRHRVVHLVTHCGGRTVPYRGS